MLFSDNEDIKVYEDVQDERPSIQLSSQKAQQQSERSNSNSVRKIKFYSNAQLMSPLEKDMVEPKDFSTPIQIAQFSQNKNPFCLQQDNDMDSSPLIKIEISAIKNIDEKQNQSEQQQSQSRRVAGDCEMMRSFDNVNHEDTNRDEEQMEEIDPIIDMMGNRVYGFELFGARDDERGELSPIIEDKENERPEKYPHVMNTPLKIRRSELRSPLVDITPSMTNKKRDDGFNTKTNKKNRTSNKTATKVFAGFDYEKLGLLTPRTMAQSRLNLSKGNSKLVNASRIKIQRFL